MKVTRYKDVVYKETESRALIILTQKDGMEIDLTYHCSDYIFISLDELKEIVKELEKLKCET